MILELLLITAGLGTVVTNTYRVTNRREDEKCGVSLALAVGSETQLVEIGSIPANTISVSWDPAWTLKARGIASSLDGGVAAQLEQLLSRVNSPAPFPPTVYAAQSGGLLIEWLRPDRRLTIFVEPTLGDSGWLFVSRDGKSYNGDLDTFSSALFAHMMQSGPSSQN